jgi:hypothetical protein
MEPYAYWERFKKRISGHKMTLTGLTSDNHFFSDVSTKAIRSALRSKLDTRNVADHCKDVYFGHLLAHRWRCRSVSMKVSVSSLHL